MTYSLQTEELLKSISDLKLEKKNGYLDSQHCLNNQQTKWRDKIEYNTLEKCILHQNEQIRLEVLELLSLSIKSTQLFTSQEFLLILKFLRYNFGEKIEFVPLIKKVVKRLVDGYAVLKREDLLKKKKNLQDISEELKTLALEDKECTLMKEYRQFVTNLHDLCVENIYPGAVNIRIKSSLQILTLMNDLLNQELKQNLWNLKKMQEVYNCLLLNTYDVNKEIAFNLLKSVSNMDPLIGGKNEVLDVINVAVDLANSIRPLDSITASYMLKIALLCPSIHKIYQDSNSDTHDIHTTSYHLIKLLFEKLQKNSELASKNIVVAASRHSLYGYLYCIRKVLEGLDFNQIKNEAWKKLLQSIILLCFELTIAVSTIVNNSSPEGHLPMDLDPKHLESVSDDLANLKITPQRVLLVSWRTVKEISLLFGYITTHASISTETSFGLLDEIQVKSMGENLVTMLCETKHRGAFEQAYVGFSDLCKRLAHSEIESLRVLPRFWLHQLFLAIIGVTNENSKLCSTRRSAGVPFMVQAVIVSETGKGVDSKNLIFYKVMKILLKLCELKNDLEVSPVLDDLLENDLTFSNLNNSELTNFSNFNKATEIKTHALNILRTLYKHAPLAKMVQDYVADGFIVALNGYDSDSWMVRNAASLLFSALVTRTFGVQRTKDYVNLTNHNKLTGKLFFEKYPKLQGYLLDELKKFLSSEEKIINTKIFSILLIMTRVHSSPSEGENIKWNMDKFIDLLTQCGKSKVYVNRELAARALVPLLTENNVNRIFLSLVMDLTSGLMSLNGMHGYALQILEIVQNPTIDNLILSREIVQKFLNYSTCNILDNLETSDDKPACFPLATVIVKIVITILNLNSYNWILSDVQFLSLLNKVAYHLTNRSKLKTKGPGIELYEEQAASLLFYSCKRIEAIDHLEDLKKGSIAVWASLLYHETEEVQCLAWSNLIFYLQDENKKLCSLAIILLAQSVNTEVNNPSLENAKLKFFTKVLHERKINNIPSKTVFELVKKKIDSGSYYPRGELFELLAEAWASMKGKNEELLDNDLEFLCDIFFANSGMESNVDCRIGVSEGMAKIYLQLDENENNYFVLEWWTILFQLLIDDNKQVRANVAKTIHNIQPKTELSCEAITIKEFFDKFYLTFESYPQTLIIVLFVWNMMSASYDMEEMDESNVFNKSCNYEVFEPWKITKFCINKISNFNVNEFSKSKILFNERQWVQKHLGLSDDEMDFETLEDLVVKYKKIVFKTHNSLRKILDPTYSVKFIKQMAYEHFVEAITAC